MASPPALGPADIIPLASGEPEFIALGAADIIPLASGEPELIALGAADIIASVAVGDALIASWVLIADDVGAADAEPPLVLTGTDGLLPADEHAAGMASATKASVARRANLMGRELLAK